MKAMSLRYINKNEFIIVSVCSVLILLSTLFYSYIVSSIVSVLVFAIYFIHLINKNKTIITKYFHLVFSVFFMLASLVVLESIKTDLVEIKETSHFVGSIPLLVLAYFVFFLVLDVIDRRLVRNKGYKETFLKDFVVDDIKKKKSVQIVNILCVFADIAYLYMFISVFHTPSFKLGIDRFTYSMDFFESHSRIFTFLNQYVQLIIIPCILAVIYGNKILGITGLALYSLFMFWIGNKFGSFAAMISVFLMINSNNMAGGNSRKKQLYIILLVILLAVVSFFALSFTVNGSNTVQRFINRIAAQGQLWWRTFDLTKGEAHPEQIVNELKGMIYGHPSVDENVGANYGIYNIMYLCAPANMVDTKLETGSRYTEAGYATSLYCLGPIGPVLFSILAAIAIVYIVNTFLKAVNSNQIFKAAIILRLYFLAITSLSMGIYMTFFSRLSLITYVYLFLTRNKKICLSPIKGKDKNINTVLEIKT